MLASQERPQDLADRPRQLAAGRRFELQLDGTRPDAADPGRQLVVLGREVLGERV